jgi:hypothetical protein
VTSDDITLVAPGGTFLVRSTYDQRRSHTSLKTNRSITPKTASPKAVLNLICSKKGNLTVHTT